MSAFRSEKPTAVDFLLALTVGLPFLVIATVMQVLGLLWTATGISLGRVANAVDRVLDDSPLGRFVDGADKDSGRE